MSSNSDGRVLRVLSTPRMVTVELGRALDLARRGLPANRVPLWLRAKGWRIEEPMPAELLGWCRLCDGQFLANIRVRLESSLRDVEPLSMTLWVTQDAVHAEATTPSGKRLRGK
jgi:hypothetical protein